MLLQAGVVSRLGKIEDGNTVLDYEPEEIKRRGSIQPGFAAFEQSKQVPEIAVHNGEYVVTSKVGKLAMHRPAETSR